MCLFCEVYTSNYRLSSTICPQSGNQPRCENRIFHILVIYEMLWWTACEVNRMLISIPAHSILLIRGRKKSIDSSCRQSGQAWITVLHIVSFQSDCNVDSVWGHWWFPVLQRKEFLRWLREREVPNNIVWTTSDTLHSHSLPEFHFLTCNMKMFPRCSLWVSRPVTAMWLFFSSLHGGGRTCVKRSVVSKDNPLERVT